MKAFFGLTGCLLALACVKPVGASAAEKLTLALNWTASGEQAAIYYALHSGMFEAANLAVTVEQGQGASAAAQRTGSGSADLGIADLATAMTARGAGADLVAVMNIYAKSPYRTYWLKSSGMKGIADFPGHTFGDPAADVGRVMWPALAKQNNIDPDSVKWVNIAPSAKISALKSKVIDGTTSFSYRQQVMENVFGDDLAWSSWSDMGVDSYGNSVIVNGKFLKENPDRVRRFVRVMQRAYLYCAQHSQECVNILPEYSSGLKMKDEMYVWDAAVDLMTDEFSAANGFGSFKAERVAADLELVSKYLGIKKPFPAAAIFTNEFVDPSLKLVKTAGN
jgi:NitT/TauT family transport system substrate-binding protein